MVAKSKHKLRINMGCRLQHGVVAKSKHKLRINMGCRLQHGGKE